MARATGLEPAASGVTGRRSNQLSYARKSKETNRERSAVTGDPLRETGRRVKAKTRLSSDWFSAKQPQCQIPATP